MMYWVREIAGWALVVGGLAVFWTAYNLLLAKRVFEAGPVVFIGFVVFRGGVHLLKVAVAARAARQLPEPAKKTPTRRPLGSTRPIGPTPAKTVLPGPRNRPRAEPVGRGRDR